LKGIIMALPNGAGGYQLGDGNLNEPVLGYLPTPLSETGVTTVTLTAAEVTGGILVANPGTTGTTYTMPIVVTAGGVAGVNDSVPSAKVGSTFNWTVINIGTTTGDITLAAGTGTGWTIVGALVIDNETSASFVARKTSDTTWTLYRTA
jgi:hypothetical protein